MTGQPAGHAHDIDLQASLDFVNTLELEDGRMVISDVESVRKLARLADE